MKSYTIGRNYYGTLTKNAASANLLIGDQFANDEYRDICSMKDWPFLTRLRTLTTVASQQFYNMPYDCEQVAEIAVIVSSIRYVPKQSPSQDHWDRLNLSSFTSDIPEWWFTLNGQIGLWPKPASNGNTINVTQKTKVIDLSAADYSTGGVLTATNGSTAVVGTGTTWTTQMTGRFIRISYSDTVNTGDGMWYEIASVQSATALTLVRNYGGSSISTGNASYVIGQMPLLPEAFHVLPWISAAASYWGKEVDKRADFFQKKRDTQIVNLIRDWSSPTTDMVIDDGNDEEILNPNLTISI